MVFLLILLLVLLLVLLLILFLRLLLVFAIRLLLLPVFSFLILFGTIFHLLVSDMCAIQFIQTQLNINCSPRMYLLLISSDNPDSDRFRNAYLLQPTKLLSQKPSNQKSFFNIYPKTFENDEFMILKFLSCLVKVDPCLFLPNIDDILELLPIIVFKQLQYNLLTVKHICLLFGFDYPL